jgi:hypothetical protein
MTRRSGARARTMKRIRQFYVLTVVIYLIMGVLLVGVAYAQQASQSWVFPTPGTTQLKVPTGSDDAQAQAYFNYLQLQTYAGIHETYHVNVIALLEVYGVGGLVLGVLYLFMFAWYARLRTDDLYPVEVYNGYVTERGGPIDPFNWAVWTIMIIYAVAYIAVSLTYGQLY